MAAVDKAPKAPVVERDGSKQFAAATPQRILMTPQDFRRLSNMIDVYSVHLDAAALLARSGSVHEHVVAVQEANANLKAGEAPQTEILLARFKPHLGRSDVADASRMLHIIRGKKEAPTPEKVNGLRERGFMLVPEPNAIFILRRMVPKAFQEASPVSVAR